MTAALALLPVDGRLRLAVTVAFFLVAPGWAAGAVIRPPGGAPPTSLRWAVSIGASIAAEGLVAQAMLLVGWHPAVAYGGMLALTATLLAVHLLRPETPA